MEDRTFELISKHLDPESFMLVAQQDNAPSAEAVQDVFDAFGCACPDAFLTHATGQMGGLYVEVKESLWPRAEKFQVGPFWSFLYGLYTLNVSEGIPEFMDLQAHTEQFREESELKAVPFLKVVGDADVYCFNEQGNVVRWSHETNELEAEDKDFWDVLDRELAELADRKRRKVAGEDKTPDA